MSETLFTARAPEVLAEFEADPSPEALLALGARVEEDSLHLGKWRGTGAKTWWYVLELPYPKVVLLGGAPVNRVALKVPPSGRAKVEEAHLDEEGMLWKDIQASREVWALARALGLEKAAREVYEGHPAFREGAGGRPRAALRRWNGLLSELVWLKARALPAVAYPGAPIGYYVSLAPYQDPGATLEGTLENLRRGAAREMPGYDPARDPGVGIALYPELGLGVPEPAAFPEEPRPLSRKTLEALPETPLVGRGELEGALEAFLHLLRGVGGGKGPRGVGVLAALRDLASSLALAEQAHHTARLLRGLGLPVGEAERTWRRREKELLKKAEELGLGAEDLDSLAPLLRLTLGLPTGPGRGFSGGAFLRGS